MGGDFEGIEKIVLHCGGFVTRRHDDRRRRTGAGANRPNGAMNTPIKR
jgi:hypothetical protein